MPQLVRATRMEPAKWQPDGAVHQILREQLGDTDCTFECADGTHGFMIRSTMKSAREAAAVRKGIGELISFCAYAIAFPNSFLALIDTYDTLKSGTPNYVAVALTLKKCGLCP